MKINIPKKINICGTDYKVFKDKKENGAYFYLDPPEIYIGTKHKNKQFIIEGLVHEISEIIHITLGTRYSDIPNDSYIFIMDHSKFQSHNEILTGILISNKIIK